ncbi:hypothetical protein PN441_00405 [Spirulina major CS-329]|nr:MULTISPECIES: hypothetical protein [Spirulina]MDB9494163.1 hypothetical protein [Spirulina subsalsa CS-330]MDB9501515.1 hypothetical protein [Spirulina major CS-329]
MAWGLYSGAIAPVPVPLAGSDHDNLSMVKHKVVSESGGWIVVLCNDDE